MLRPPHHYYRVAVSSSSFLQQPHRLQLWTRTPFRIPISLSLHSSSTPAIYRSRNGDSSHSGNSDLTNVSASLLRCNYYSTETTERQAMSSRLMVGPFLKKYWNKLVQRLQAQFPFLRPYIPPSTSDWVNWQQTKFLPVPTQVILDAMIGSFVTHRWKLYEASYANGDNNGENGNGNGNGEVVGNLTLPERTKRVRTLKLTTSSHRRNSNSSLHYKALKRSVEDEVHNFFNQLRRAVTVSQHSDVDELKRLYDAFDPDLLLAPTIVKISEEGQAVEDFLQKLDNLMRTANYVELSPEELTFALNETRTIDGVVVKINRNDYDNLRVWVQGKLNRPLQLSFFKGITQRIRRKIQFQSEWLNKALDHVWPIQSASSVMYQRIMIATKLHKQHQVYLKIFKDIRIDHLEYLLPKFDVKMPLTDQGLLIASAGGGSITLITKAADMHVNKLPQK